MLSRLRDRFGAKMIVIGTVVVLLGGGVAAAATDTLPEPAQQALAGVAERITDIYGDSETTAEGEETTGATATEDSEIVISDTEATETETSDTEGEESDGEGMPEEVETFLTELHTWIGCIQDGARAHGEQQSNADTRIEDDEYTEEDKLALCGEKPVNLNDTDSELEEEEEIEDTDGEEPEGEGMPEEVQTFLTELHTWIGCIQDGARAHGEQQSNADTRIEDDEYTEEDKLALCGDKPINPNDNGEGGEIEGEGRPEDAGPPPWAGGPPPWAGRPDDAGPPSGAGRP